MRGVDWHQGQLCPSDCLVHWLEVLSCWTLLHLCQYDWLMHWLGSHGGLRGVWH